jgi:hypothetical protein
LFSTFVAIWDITKYEQNVEREYAQLLEECFRSLRALIPPQTIIIWLTAVTRFHDIYARYAHEMFSTCFQTPFSKDARGVLDETRSEKKKFLRIRIFDINRFSSQLAMKYNFQVVDLHYLVRQRVQHRCKDGMHYDALIHREITTHIARYISCGFYQSLPKPSHQHEATEMICEALIKSMIDKLDCQLTRTDQEIIDGYQGEHLLQQDMVEYFDEKEKQLLYVIDHCENTHFSA